MDAHTKRRRIVDNQSRVDMCARARVLLSDEAALTRIRCDETRLRRARNASALAEVLFVSGGTARRASEKRDVRLSM